jgi:hypothetical protein
MAVFVDDARVQWRGLRWSHLVANTAEELHAAAAALGIPREGAQDKGRTLHYDLPEEWRERAIVDGLAEPIGWRELAGRRSSMAGNVHHERAPARSAARIDCVVGKARARDGPTIPPRR